MKRIFKNYKKWMGVKYSRPVIVLKKHTGRCFTGVPLTSKQRTGNSLRPE